MKKLVIYMTALILFSSCASNNQNQTTAVTTVSPPPHQVLQLVPSPQHILELMKQRGQEDEAKPILKIVSPANNSVVSGTVVQVRLNLSGDLKGYKPHKDPATDSGNHVHIILDNEPYEAYYDLNQPFEFRDVAPGKHTLRVFPSRPWHESYKNDGAFQMVTFTVEGQDASSKASEVDPSKPLLTYSRPKGEYKGKDADPIMIDFWLSNAKLKGDGGEYRVRYIIDDDDAKYIDKWEPIWLSGWTSGKHFVRLELVDKDNKPVENGGLNTTTREITVVK